MKKYYRMLYLTAQAAKRRGVNRKYGSSFRDYLEFTEIGFDIFVLSESDAEENLLLLATH